MAIYQIETESGTYEVETADSTQKDIATPTKAQEMLGKINIPGMADPLPKKSSVESMIAARPDSVQTLMDEIAYKPKNGVEDFLHIPVGLLKTAAVPFKRLEAGVAGAGLDAQAGNPGSMLDSFVKGISGQQSPELGDLIRTTGFGSKIPSLIGGNVNEMLAGTTGVIGSGTLGAGGAQLSKFIGPQVARGIVNSVGGLKNLATSAGTNVENVLKPIEFAQKVRGEMFGLRTKLGKEVGARTTALSEANPDKTIDLSGAMSGFKATIDDAVNNPGLASDVKTTLRKIKNPEDAKFVRDLIDNPDKAADLTLAQAEIVKKAISNSSPIASKMGNKFANFTAGDHELLDLIDEIKLAQAEIFPELSSIRAPYAAYMKNYNVVKGKFKPGQLIKNISEGFGDKEIEQMAKNVLPKEIYAQIRGARVTSKGAKIGGAGVLGMVGIEKAKGVFDALTR